MSTWSRSKRVKGSIRRFFIGIVLIFLSVGSRSVPVSDAEELRGTLHDWNLGFDTAADLLSQGLDPDLIGQTADMSSHWGETAKKVGFYTNVIGDALAVAKIAEMVAGSRMYPDSPVNALRGLNAGIAVAIRTVDRLGGFCGPPGILLSKSVIYFLNFYSKGLDEAIRRLDALGERLGELNKLAIELGEADFLLYPGAEAYSETAKLMFEFREKQRELREIAAFYRELAAVLEIKKEKTLEFAEKKYPSWVKKVAAEVDRQILAEQYNTQKFDALKEEMEKSINSYEEYLDVYLADEYREDARAVTVIAKMGAEDGAEVMKLLEETGKQLDKAREGMNAAKKAETEFLLWYEELLKECEEEYEKAMETIKIETLPFIGKEGDYRPYSLQVDLEKGIEAHNLLSIRGAIDYTIKPFLEDISNQPALLVRVSPAEQVINLPAEMGDSYQIPLKVKLLTLMQEPVAGTEVVFQDKGNVAVKPNSAVTGKNGIAEGTIIVYKTVKSNLAGSSVSAYVDMIRGIIATDYTFIKPGEPASIGTISRPESSALPDAELPEPWVVVVKDKEGNIINNRPITVKFIAVNGGGVEEIETTFEPGPELVEKPVFSAYLFTGAKPGETYRFKVRVIKPSRYSFVNSVIEIKTDETSTYGKRREPHSVLVGLSVKVSPEGEAGGTHIAADNKTAELLGLPRELKVGKATAGVYKTVKHIANKDRFFTIEYYRKYRKLYRTIGQPHPDDHERIKGKRKYKVLYSFVKQEPIEIAPRITSEPAGIVSTTRSEIKGRREGIAKVIFSTKGIENFRQVISAIASSGVSAWTHDGYSTEAILTPDEFFKLKSGEIKDINTIKVYQFKGFRVIAPPKIIPKDWSDYKWVGAVAPAKEVDFFQQKESEGGRAFLHSYINFGIEWRNTCKGGKVVIENKNPDVFSAKLSDGGSCELLAKSVVGSGKLLFLFQNRNGETTYAKQEVTVNSNEVKFDAERSGRFKKGRFSGNEYVLVPAEEDAEIQVVVTGDADMSKYTCRWLPTSSKKGKFSRTKTYFEKTGEDTWVSTAKVWYPKNSGDDTGDVEIVRTADEETVYRCHFYASIAPPRIQSLYLKAKREKEAGQPAYAFSYDLFYPGGAYSNLIIGVDGVSNESTRDVSGYPNLRVHRVSDDVIVVELVGDRVISPKAQSGKTTISASMFKHPEGDAKGTILIKKGKNEIFSKNRINITNNVMKVSWTGAGYKLEVTGPSDMNQYRAIWKFESASPVRKEFVQEGDEKWVCEVESKPDDYKELTIGMMVSRAGHFLPTVAKYTGRIYGLPEVEPQAEVKIGPDISKIKNTLIGLFTAYEREDVSAFLDYLSPEFRSVDNSGQGYGVAQLRIALLDDFRNLDGIEFGVEANPPLESLDEVRMEIRWYRRAILAVGGQEWLLKDRDSSLSLKYDPGQRKYLLTSIQGDPIFGLSAPTGEITIPEGSVIEGVTVTEETMVTEGQVREEEVADISGCISSIGFGKYRVFENLYLFAGIDIDPNTKSCFLRNDGQGQTLILQTPPDGPYVPPGKVISAFPDRTVKNWEFTPPSLGVSVEFAPGPERQTFRLKAAEMDLIVTIVLTVTGWGEDLILTVTAISVTEVIEVR